MSDNEIVKALECCSRGLSCKLCPYYEPCSSVLCRDAIALIKRQQAEIERLNKEVDRLSQIVLCHDGDVADAVKDFSDFLVSKAKSTKERFLLESLVESVKKEMGVGDDQLQVLP